MLRRITVAALALLLCLCFCACENSEHKAYRVATQQAVDPIAEKYNIDLKVKKAYGIYEFESENFVSLTEEDKLCFFEDIDALEMIALEGASVAEFAIVVEFIDLHSGGKVYDVSFSEWGHDLKEDGQYIHRRQIKAYDAEAEYKEYKQEQEELNNALNGNKQPEGNGFGDTKCSWCNGTGAVKYYYGDSELEAVLNGHEDSWYGTCGSCGGTGYK